MRVVWTERAEEDVWGILEFIANDNPDAAWETRERIYAAADSLEQFPKKGRPGIAPNTRELVIVPSYVLVYSVDDSRISVLRIFHAAQDYPSCIC